MRATLSAFEDLARGADWAVVYYAGHGIEVDGRNYLVPVDAQLKRDSDVEDEALPLERVLARVSVAKKMQLVILDACRDNPFARRMTPAGGSETEHRCAWARPVREPAHEPDDRLLGRQGRGRPRRNGGGEQPLRQGAGEIPGRAAAGARLLLPQGARRRADGHPGKQRPFEDSSLTDVNLFFRQAAK